MICFSVPWATKAAMLTNLDQPCSPSLSFSYKRWCRDTLYSGLNVKHTVWVKKIPPEDLCQFFQNGWEFFNQILHAYYAFLSRPTLECKFLFNYLQLWRSYAILSVATQFTSCAQGVHHRLKCTLAFSDIFTKWLGIFSPKFTHLLYVHMHARVQFFIQLSPTMTKLCHIKCDHPAARFGRWWTFWAHYGGRA